MKLDHLHMLFPTMHLIGRSLKGKWAYDHVEEWAKDYVAQLRMYRKSRDSEMYREMQRIQILLRCGTTCYWIKDKTAKRICDPWKDQAAEWQRTVYGESCRILRESLNGRALWIETEQPILLPHNIHCHGGWIVPTSSEPRISPLVDETWTPQSKDDADPLLAAIAVALIRPQICVAETPTSGTGMQESASTCSSENEEDEGIVMLPNGRRLVHVSLVKWIRKQHGARRRHRLTHGYEVDDFVRRYRYCPRCDKRIILRILGQACPRCGYLPSSHAEYKINPVKVKGHERGPLGHHGPPPTRYIA